MLGGFDRADQHALFACDHIMMHHLAQTEGIEDGALLFPLAQVILIIVTNEIHQFLESW